jgi:hypothetical protein
VKREIITIENGIVSIPKSADIRMTQYEIADLFQCFISKVNANIRAILKIDVLDETKVCRTYQYKNGNSVEQYNPEMIIALSFRIKSQHGDIFRRMVMRRAVADDITGIPILLSGRDWKNIQLN